MPRLGVLACCLSIRQVQLYHQRPMGGWCLMRVGCNMSSMSLGWSLFPSKVIIVLALVNSDMSPAGTQVPQQDPGVLLYSLLVLLPQDCCAFQLVPMCIMLGVRLN